MTASARARSMKMTRVACAPPAGRRCGMDSTSMPWPWVLTVTAVAYAFPLRTAVNQPQRIQPEPRRAEAGVELALLRREQLDFLVAHGPIHGLQFAKAATSRA